MYRPLSLAIRKEDDGLVIVDTDNDNQENAILLTLGHGNTDLPNSMIKEFAEHLVQLYNNQVNPKEK